MGDRPAGQLEQARDDRRAATTLGDRAEIMRRIEMRDRLIEEGEWEE